MAVEPAVGRKLDLIQSKKRDSLLKGIPHTFNLVIKIESSFKNSEINFDKRGKPKMFAVERHPCKNISRKSILST